MQAQAGDELTSGDATRDSGAGRGGVIYHRRDGHYDLIIAPG